MYKLLLVLNYAPSFDNNKAMQTVRAFTTPLINFLYFAIPIVVGLAAVGTAVGFFLKDEDEREQRPLQKSLKKIVLWGVIAYSINIILSLFGLSSGV